ncbi:MAG TPA: SAM-dependent methyltransferase [Candidatus Acidoferrales bacterium]|nr:SAM-dependent methyltransferase [Candidatus Acidoferrales bacterium]
MGIVIVGLGPGPLSYLTKEAEQELVSAKKIFFRTREHPAFDWLLGLGKEMVSFDLPYTFAWGKSGQIYEFMVSALLKEVELREKATYAVPGSPFVLEDTVRLLRLRGAEQKIQIKLVQGLSFIELALAEVPHDFLYGMQMVLPRTHLQPGLYRTDLALLVCQIEARGVPRDPPRVDLTAQWLMEKYPPEHVVTLIWTDGLPEYETHSKAIPLKDLAREYGSQKFFASLYVPPASTRSF